MNKFVFCCALCASATMIASAQVKAYKPDRALPANAVTYALPRTVVKVRVVAQKEVITVGPYARFAQKYLGVIAPLTDKTIYTIQSATIGSVQEADPSEVYALENPEKNPAQLYGPSPTGLMASSQGQCIPAAKLTPAMKIGPQQRCDVPQVVSYVHNDTAFLPVQVDKLSTVDRTPEAMAASAADRIFYLRKHRMDLVTGEAGENVFGGGLEAALKEIDRMEQEYMALFLGKQYTECMVREYEATPNRDDKTVVVCRFSESGGLLDDKDLSGRPITLELTPERAAEKSPLVTRKGSKDAKGSVYYRIADMVACRLTDGNKEIAKVRMPIYQCGVIVQVPVTTLK